MSTQTSTALSAWTPTTHSSLFVWAGPSEGHKVPREEYESLVLYEASSYFNALALRLYLSNGCWWFTDKEMLLWLFSQELPSEQSNLKSGCDALQNLAVELETKNQNILDGS